MYKCACFFACMFIGILALGEANAQELVGAFQITIGNSASSVELRLECESESTCVFMTISQQGSGSPVHDINMLGKVRPVDDLARASNALKYAVEQRSRRIQNPEFADLMKRLGPVMSGAPIVKKCWDLNYNSPAYLLACAIPDRSAGRTSLYLFATLTADCGEAFCRYIIYPMTRVK